MKPTLKCPVVLVANNPLGHHLLTSQLLHTYEALDLDSDVIVLCNGVMPHADISQVPWATVVSFGTPNGGAFAYARLVVMLIRLRFCHPHAVYHLRGFVTAAAFCLSRLGRLRRSRYVYDPRGAFPVEWQESGRPRRVGDLLGLVERCLVRNASTTIVTSERFRQLFEEQFGDGPTYATIYNATSFPLVDSERSFPSDGPVRVVYLGTFNHWHPIDEVARVMTQVAGQLGPERVELFVYTLPRFHDLVRETFGTIDCAGLTVDYVRYEVIPSVLIDKHIGVSVVRPTLSSSIASPIKVADYVAIGLVPLMNEGVGDFDEHFRSNGSGVLYEFGGDVDLTGLAEMSTTTNQQIYDVVSQSEALRRLAPVVGRLRHG